MGYGDGGERYVLADMEDIEDAAAEVEELCEKPEGEEGPAKTGFYQAS